MKKCQSIILQATIIIIMLTAGDSQAAVDLTALTASIGSSDDLKIWFYLDVYNNGTDTVDRNRISIKYWFMFEKGHEISLNYMDAPDDAAVRFTPIADREGVDMLAEISFTESVDIAPGSSLGRFEMQYVDDWWGTNQEETNDYSFRSVDPSTLALNDKVTVYYNGVLVYGTEPALRPCFDGIQNGEETGVDYGGSCTPCPNDILNSVLYPVDWTPGFQVNRTGNNEPLFLQDYSYAGYRNGEVPLPADPATIIITPAPNDGSADVTAQIQNALDTAAAEGGGVILVQPGIYQLDGQLIINSSNVVLRGAGAEQTKLFFTQATDAITLGGSENFTDEASWVITAEGQIFDTYVDVQNATGIIKGDNIVIAWNITDEFRQEHNSSAWWNHVPADGQRIFFRRTVSRVQGNRIYFKVPLRYPVKLRDTPTVRKTVSYISGSAVEHMSLSTAVNSVEDSWNDIDQATTITLQGCKDCWIQDIKSFAKEGQEYHLRSHGIYIENSFQVTVADCHLERSQHLGPGGNGYLFQVSRSNEVLVRDSVGRYGRYNFSLNWDFGAIGNVFLRVESSDAKICNTLQNQLDDTCYQGGSNFHHSLATANLFDSGIINDELSVANRKDWSLGAGQTGTQNVFWNTKGSGMLYSYNFGMGYIIGTEPGMTVYTDPSLAGWPFDRYATGTAPEDFSEHLGFGHQLKPNSLYEDQLTRRLDTFPDS